MDLILQTQTLVTQAVLAGEFNSSVPAAPQVLTTEAGINLTTEAGVSITTE